MVKFKIRHNILFKPKWKFLKIASFYKNRKDANFIVKKKEFSPSFPLNSFSYLKKKLIVKNNLSTAVPYSSLELKKIWYNLIKIYSRRDHPFFKKKLDKDCNLDQLSLKFQVAKFYNSKKELRKKLLNGFLQSRISSFYCKLKKQGFTNLDKTLFFERPSSVSSTNSKDFELLSKGFTKFQPKINISNNPIIWDLKKKKLFLLIKQKAFFKKILRKRMFMFNSKFRKKYKKVFKSLEINRYNLLVFWLKHNYDEKVFRINMKEKASMSKTFLKKRGKKGKWLILTRKYRKQLKILKNFFPSKNFELNFKTFSFLSLGSFSSAKNGVKIPFDLEIRKLLSFLSA